MNGRVVDLILGSRDSKSTHQPANHKRQGTANNQGDDQWFGISLDIEDLHASEEMYEAQTRAIVETAVDGIITIDSSAIVRFVKAGESPRIPR